MNIRQEQKDDYVAVYNVIKKAFKIAENSDVNEAELVEALRKSNFLFLNYRLLQLKTER